MSSIGFKPMGDRQPMLHAVVHYPRLGSPGLDEFRRKHDPFAELIPEHITLVFPIPTPLETLRTHAHSVTRTFEPFEVHIEGLSRTWDHWLYLEIQEGREEIVELHDRLYSGPLKEFLRTDLPFEPHVGIGFFGTGPYDPLDPETVTLDSEAYESARAEAADLGIDASRTVRSLTIVRLDTERNTVENVEDVPLGGGGGRSG